MSRIIPPCPPEPEIKESLFSPGTKTRTYTIAVITPLFGGGTKPGVNDPITLIRPSSIRGHLRFWWRATRGAKYQTVEELRQCEGEVWGTTKQSSQVSIEVKSVSTGSEEACAVLQQHGTMPKFNDGYPPYALFSFQGNARERTPPAKARKNVEFSLALRYPAKVETEVQAALWAWVNFGGIGARTRRGCGALYCSEFAPSSTSRVADWLTNARKKYELPEKPQARPWSTFGIIYLALKNPQLTLTAWNEAIRIFQEFRQGVGVGRNLGRSTNQPGRSRWPEADSLRALTGRGEARHFPSITASNLRENPAFPRAAFGLPIIFHFKDSADSPNDSELYPKERTRMASPIILRPLALDAGGQSVALIVQLSTPRLEVLVLKKLPANPELTASHISRPELAKYDKSPLGPPAPGKSPRSPTGSALEAFIAFAKEKGFQECKP